MKVVFKNFVIESNDINEVASLITKLRKEPKEKISNVIRKASKWSKWTASEKDIIKNNLNASSRDLRKWLKKNHTRSAIQGMKHKIRYNKVD